MHDQKLVMVHCIFHIDQRLPRRDPMLAMYLSVHPCSEIIRSSRIERRKTPESTSHHDTRVAGNTLESLVLARVRVDRFMQLTGHSSAASFPTGPVMAEPFISPLGLTICEAKGQRHVHRNQSFLYTCRKI
jgi:hypothetical protein